MKTNRIGFDWQLIGVLVALLAVPCAVAQDAPARRQALFGDLHIHTMYSFDAYSGNNRTTPDDAYRFAKGEPIPHPTGATLRLSGEPLDFLAVTDHSEFLGVHVLMSEPSSPIYGHPAAAELLPRGGVPLTSAIARLREWVAEDPELIGEQTVGTAWARVVAAAERHNDPGKFTTFVAYEYSPSPGSRHLHRNVIFASANVPKLPFSSLDSADPEDLWNWLDEQRARGIEALAIPHNMNQSDGLAFPGTTWKGEPIDADFAQKRMRNEPIAEITQKKGTSETHPSLSPEDEWADFEIVQYYLNRRDNTNPISIFEGGYLRDALETGLEMEERGGFNPYRLGVIGSSDSHMSAGPYEEDKLFSPRANTPQSRGSAYPEGGSWEGFWTPRQATHGTGGLTGVWSEENTRESIYAALRRRETFATSGPRIRVRFFGGFGLAKALGEGRDLVATAYRRGTPMGGLLPASHGRPPSFLIQAMRDTHSGWLQRAQVIKGWVENGEALERVFDVACSDGLEPDPETHRCPDNGARVNLADCSVSRDKGASQLEAIWTDPEFDAGARAFYYLRVLENPSCRWSTWDAIRLGIEPNPDLAATIQERAWSSPVWYSP